MATEEYSIGYSEGYQEGWNAAMDSTPPAAPVQEPTVEENSQDWAGMDGATAWHLIDRHADGWADVAKMMGEWLAANTPPAAQPAPVQEPLGRLCVFDDADSEFGWSYDISGNAEQHRRLKELDGAKLYTTPFAAQPTPVPDLTHDQWDEWQDKHGLILEREALDELRSMIYTAAAQPAPVQHEPEIVQRVKRYAGQTMRTARNPNITARECIELANWLAANTTLPAAPVQDNDHEFKNFHRQLCERFGYTHDEVDWKRDQISLIEWIAKQVKSAAPVQEPKEWDERCVLGHCGSPTGCELSNRCRADTPPAAQRQWVGLSQDDRDSMWRKAYQEEGRRPAFHWYEQGLQDAAAKLREKNAGENK